MKQSASAKRFPVRSLVLAAVLSAVAFLLMFVDFSIPALIPSFIKMDVSDLCALLGSFLLGPVWGIAISAMKNILILLLKVELRFLPVSYGIGWLSMLIYELPLLIRYLKEDKL